MDGLSVLKKYTYVYVDMREASIMHEASLERRAAILKRLFARCIINTLKLKGQLPEELAEVEISVYNCRDIVKLTDQRLLVHFDEVDAWSYNSTSVPEAFYYLWNNLLQPGLLFWALFVSLPTRQAALPRSKPPSRRRPVMSCVCYSTRSSRHTSLKFSTSDCLRACGRSDNDLRQELARSFEGC